MAFPHPVPNRAGSKRRPAPRRPFLAAALAQLTKPEGPLRRPPATGIRRQPRRQSRNV